VTAKPQSFLIEPLATTGAAEARGPAAAGFFGSLLFQQSLFTLATLLAWEILGAYLVDPFWSSRPSLIFQRIWLLWQRGDLTWHVYATLTEAGLGLALGSVIGVAIGLLMARYTRAAQVTEPLFMGLYSLPRVALAPLFILWFGIGILSKVVVVAVLVVFPVTINTETGLRTTPMQLVETVRAFGATSRQIFFKVSLPSALPFIFAGLRLGIGRGLIGVVVAELFGARAGLGQLISQSAETFNMPNLFAGVTLLAVAGIAMTSGFTWLEQKLLPWRD
jgi:NitT/TauT family transport system permease protein